MSADKTRCFGTAWLAFAVALACHVADEAVHDFLSIYNPNALAIRARFPFLIIPTFTFREWIVGLSAAVLLLVCLTPLATRGTRWIRIVALPLGIIVGIANGTMHIASSIYMHRLMPGVLSAPLLILAGVSLIWCSRTTKEASIESLRGCLNGPSLSDIRELDHREDRFSEDAFHKSRSPE